MIGGGEGGGKKKRGQRSIERSEPNAYSALKANFIKGRGEEKKKGKATMREENDIIKGYQK